MRFLLLPLFPLLLAACSPDIDLTPPGSRPVPLYDQSPERTDLDRLTYLGGVVLTNPDDRFGGFSALTVSADGIRLLALSDSAYWMTANFGWSENDGTLYVGNFSMAPMLSRTGNQLGGTAADSEAIADLVQAWVPLTYEAFQDYRAGGAFFSAQDLAVVRRMLAGETVEQEESGLSKREWRELQGKLNPSE